MLTPKTPTGKHLDGIKEAQEENLRDGSNMAPSVSMFDDLP